MEEITSTQKIFLSIMIVAIYLLYVQYRNFQRKTKVDINKFKNSTQRLNEAHELLKKGKNASEIEEFWDEDRKDKDRK